MMKSNSFNWILAFTLFGVSQLVFSLPPSDIQKMIEKLHSFKSMSAQFEQVVKDVNDTVIQKSEGFVNIQKPGRFKWDTKLPFQQLLLVKDNVLWVYDENLEQASKHSIEQEIGKTPVLLLTGNASLIQKAFRVSQKQKSDGLEWFEIAPLKSKEGESTFQNVLIGFKKNLLKQMIIHDNLGQTSVISFKAIQYNIIFPADFFDFIPPSGVDIIDNNTH